MFRTFRQPRQPTKTHHVFVCFDASSSRFARESGFSPSQAKPSNNNLLRRADPPPSRHWRARTEHRCLRALEVSRSCPLVVAHVRLRTRTSTTIHDGRRRRRDPGGLGDRADV